MRTQYKVLCLILFMLLNFCCMANSSETEIFLKPEETQFVIEVKAIPTSGYVWSVKSFDKTQFSFEGAEYLKSEDKNSIGAPLQEQFRFTLLKPLASVQQIKLSLARSWEKEDVKISTFSILLQAGEMKELDNPNKIVPTQVP